MNQELTQHEIGHQNTGQQDDPRFKPLPGFPGFTFGMLRDDALQLDLRSFCDRYQIFWGNTDDITAHLVLLAFHFVQYPNRRGAPSFTQTNPLRYWHDPANHHELPLDLEVECIRAMIYAGRARKFSYSRATVLRQLVDNAQKLIEKYYQALPPESE